MILASLSTLLSHFGKCVPSGTKREAFSSVKAVLSARMYANMCRTTWWQKKLVSGIIVLKTLQRIHGTARVNGPRDSGLLSTATEAICRVHMSQHTAYRHSLSS